MSKISGSRNKTYSDFAKESQQESPAKKSFINYFVVEKISDFIGTKEEAKNSVVWYVITRTIRWSWVSIFLLVLVDIYQTGGDKSLDIIVKVSSIFIPIITLALGYLFGKKESDN